MTTQRFALVAALCAALAPLPAFAQQPAAIGGADLLQPQLRGVSGSIAVRFGGH